MYALHAPFSAQPSGCSQKQRQRTLNVHCKMQQPLQNWPLHRPGSASQFAQHSKAEQRRTACKAWFNQQSPEEKVSDFTQPRQGEQLESLRVRKDVRERVTGAVEDLGGKVTVGDVSARAGVTPAEAEEALQALAADSQGTLQVSTEGDVLYVLPSGFRGQIAARSWLLRAEPAISKVASVANYLARVAFGTALVTSVIVVWVAIFAILSSASSDRDDRRSNRSYGGGGMNIWFSPSDMFFFTDPYYMRRRSYYTYGTAAQREQPKMNFVESIFSFVFGDGDPNAGWEEYRWQTLGKLIAARGGVVTAEELAPYLDLPTGGAKPDDEGYVVPALLKFNGHPEVDDSGNLLYVFPDLQRSGGAAQSRGTVERLLTKQEWQQTEAEGEQQAGTIALGVANVVGVTWLSSLLAEQSVQYALANSSLGFVVGAMPFLQAAFIGSCCRWITKSPLLFSTPFCSLGLFNTTFVCLHAYAAAFFGIPIVRWVLNKRRNAKIEEENASRREAAARLAAPRPQLAAKLEAARRMGRAAKRIISDRDIAYRSDRGFDEQKAQGGMDWEMEDFDRRLQQQSRDKTRG